MASLFQDEGWRGGVIVVVCWLQDHVLSSFGREQQTQVLVCSVQWSLKALYYSMYLDSP